MRWIVSIALLVLLVGLSDACFRHRRTGGAASGCAECAAPAVQAAPPACSGAAAYQAGCRGTARPPRQPIFQGRARRGCGG